MGVWTLTMVIHIDNIIFVLVCQTNRVVAFVCISAVLLTKSHLQGPHQLLKITLKSKLKYWKKSRNCVELKEWAAYSYWLLTVHC